MPDHPTRFETLLGLSALPWFDVRDGRIAMVDPDVGPIADVHTHLALGYLGSPRVDLEREHPLTCTYLPQGAPLDLDLYANRNISPADTQAMKRDLVLRAATSGGLRATHTRPNLERDLTDTGVARGVLLPIDFPFLSRNAETWLGLVRGGGMLSSFGSVHPYHPRARAHLERQRDLGARGIKFHPNVQMVAPDHPKALALFRMAGELGLMVFFHAGPVGIAGEAADRRCRMRLYERAVADHPGTTFILGHSGALELDVGLELAEKYPNVWLEIASQSLAGVREIVEKAPRDRIMHGSDWPFYHPAMSVAKALIATEGDPEARHALLWANAARLFGLATPPA